MRLRLDAIRWPMLALGVLLIAGLSGCGGTGETREQAAPVPQATGDVELRRIWSQRVARGHDGQFLFLEPVVVNDTVFAATADGYLTAYNARNGRRDWWRNLDEVLLGGVGADGDHLYVVTRSGELVALSHEGEEQWRALLPNESLVPPQSNRTQVMVQTIDGQILAFDRDSGDRRWQYDTNMPVLSYRGNATPWVNDDWVITGFDNGRVVALEARTGRMQWTHDVSTPSGRTELERLVDVDGSPVVQNGNVFVAGYQGKVAALELQGGEEIWSRPVSSLRSPGVDGNNLMVVGANGQLSGYNLRSRSELWRDDSLQWRRLTSPVALDDHFLVGDFEGYLYAIDQEDGRIASHVQVDEQGLRSDMIRYRDRVIVFGNGGQLASYRIVKP